MSDAKRYEEFSELIRLYSSQMLAYIDSLLLNRSDAEGLFQDTCIVLWQKFDEFRRGTNFLAWALRIADYKVMNFQQKQSRRYHPNNQLSSRTPPSRLHPAHTRVAARCYFAPLVLVNCRSVAAHAREAACFSMWSVF
jgi:RNA polymerase sigma factor (sigma-70 family)